MMKGAGDGCNARDYPFFLDLRHDPGVVVHQTGVPDTIGLPPPKALLTFTTIAQWQNDKMVKEYVLYDIADMMQQAGIGA